MWPHQRERNASLLGQPGESLARHAADRPRHELGAIYRVGDFLLGGSTGQEEGKQQKKKGLTAHSDSLTGK